MHRSTRALRTATQVAELIYWLTTRGTRGGADGRDAEADAADRATGGLDVWVEATPGNAIGETLPLPSNAAASLAACGLAAVIPMSAYEA